MSKSMYGMGPARPHLVSPGGTSGELLDLRNDANQAFGRMETAGAGGTGVIAVEEWLAPEVAVADYFLVATAFTAAAQTVASTAVALSAPRNIVLDVVIGAGVGAGDVIVHGVDAEGKSRAVTIALPAATGTVDGLVALSSVTSIEIPADGGGAFAGTVAVGFGDAIGLGSAVVYRSFGPHVLEELEDGLAAVAGVWVTKANAPPFGTYAPNSVPNAALNFLVTYERDNS